MYERFPPRTVVKIVSLILSIVFCNACKNTIEAVSTEKNPACKTILEGRYIVEEKFKGQSPALLITERREKKFIFGKMLEVGSEGILFDRDPLSAMVDPEPEFYPYTKIHCAVDSAGKVIYGALPHGAVDTWDLQFILRDTTNRKKKPYEVTFFINKPFSYCIDPGIYTVESIFFTRGDDYVNEAELKDTLLIQVKDHERNSIGTIYSNTSIIPPHNLSLKMKMKSLRDPNDAAVGFMFGLVGSAIYAASKGDPSPQELFFLADSTKNFAIQLK